MEFPHVIIDPALPAEGLDRLNEVIPNFQASFANLINLNLIELEDIRKISIALEKYSYNTASLRVEVEAAIASGVGDASFLKFCSDLFQFIQREALLFRLKIAQKKPALPVLDVISIGSAEAHVAYAQSLLELIHFKLSIVRDVISGFDLIRQVSEIARDSDQMQAAFDLLDDVKTRPWALNQIREKFASLLVGETPAGVHAKKDAFRTLLVEGHCIVKEMLPSIPTTGFEMPVKRREEMYASVAAIQDEVKRLFKIAMHLISVLKSPPFNVSAAAMSPLEKLEQICRPHIQLDQQDPGRALRIILSPFFNPENRMLDRAFSPQSMRTPAIALAAGRSGADASVSRWSQFTAFLSRNKARIGGGVIVGALASLPVTWPLLIGAIGLGLGTTAVAGAGVLLGLTVTPKTPAPAPRDSTIKNQRSAWARFGRFYLANTGKILGSIVAAGAIAALPFAWPVLLAAVAVKAAIVIATLAPLAVEAISVGIGHYFDQKRNKASHSKKVAWATEGTENSEGRVSWEPSFHGTGSTAASDPIGSSTISQPPISGALLPGGGVYSPTQPVLRTMMKKAPQPPAVAAALDLIAQRDKAGLFLPTA